MTLALTERADHFTVCVALHRALSAISSQCDGAHSLDGVGFNGHDALFGNRVARYTQPTDWDADMAAEVHRMLRTYRGQLAKRGIDYDLLPVPAVQAESTVYAAREAARAAERKSKRGIKVYKGVDAFLVKGQGTFDVKDTIKAWGARWDADLKAWSFGLDQTDLVLGLVQSVDWLGVDDSAEALLAGAEPAAAKPKTTSKVAKVVKSKVAIGWRGLSDEEFLRLRSAVRDLPGHEYLSSKKVNVVHLSREALAFVVEHGFEGAEDVEAALITLEEEERDRILRETAAESASHAFDTEREVALAEHLYAYQRAGVEYVLDHADGRAIIGDEMGLGKTRQAIAALEDRLAYPAVVVCPPHLVRTWKAEYDKVNPDRVVRILKGTKPSTALVEGADVLVIGYAVLKPWVEYRIDDPETGEVLLKPKAVVFDESHFAKNHSSQRTKAALALAGRVREDGLRLCLTGTPVLNRVDEILSQIELIGRWKDFGSKAEFIREYQYAGTNKLQQLNVRLRRSCYVRRLKSQVLADLPPKVRHEVEVEVSEPFVVEYTKAARDVIAYLQSVRGDEKAFSASRAQTLVQLNVLRQIAGRAKVAAAVEWVEEFMRETERSLVVFASHIDVQDGIYSALEDRGISVARIHGSDSDTKVESEKERFMSGEARVIVASLKKGGTGHTLTAASDTLIVEQDWTPANLNQAEDRVHRIGQDAESVTATHLVADLPMDQHLRAVVARKQVICDAVAQGAAGLDDAPDTKVLDEVIDLLLADIKSSEAAA